MGKLLKAVLLAFISLMIVTVSGLYLFRHAIVEAVISDQLRQRGFPLQSIEIPEVSFNSLQLQDITAGKSSEFRLKNLQLAWNFQELLAGKPVSAMISGLQATIDLKAGASNFTMPQSQMPVAQWKISIPWLPELKLSDSAVYFRTASGDITLALSGSIGAIQSGKQEIHLGAVTSASFLQATTVFKGTFDNQGNLQGKISVSEARFDTPEAKIADFSSETSFVFSALRPQQIQTNTSLSGIRLLRKEEASAAELALEEISLAGEFQRSADSMQGEMDFRITGGQITADALKLEQLAVSIPAQIKLHPSSVQIGLREQAHITLGKIFTGYLLQIKDFKGFSIDQADLDLAKDDHGITLQHRISILPANLTLLDERPDSSARKVQIHPGTISLIGKLSDSEKYQGTLAISNAAVNLPAQIQASDISVALHLNDQEDDAVASFAIGRVHHLAAEPLFAALSFAGGIRDIAKRGEPAVYALTLSGGVPRLDYMKLTGQYATGTGKGKLKAEIVPLSFSPGALQPSDLLSSLAPLQDVSGKVNAYAQLRWDKDGVQSSGAELEMRDLSFTRETLKLNDLNAMLHLDNLIALSSERHQSITIRRVDSGIPLEKILISYHIEGTTPPRLAIQKAQFSVINGVVSLVPTVIDPAAAQTDILLRIEDIDLETFFNLIKIDGLAGSGQLDGQIPITLKDNVLTITNGHLAARSPGILRFKSEKASKMLSSAGKEMNLLLQAAQEFHYTELSLNLDKSGLHDLVVKLSVLGNNPNVKDGQPFRLNIKLETDIEKILQTINQGYHLSHEILRGSFILR